MKNTIEYKGYIGSVEFSEEDNILFGKVVGVSSLISYEGTTVAELIDNFHKSVDEYLDSCKMDNVTPEVCYGLITSAIIEVTGIQDFEKKDFRYIPLWVGEWGFSLEEIISAYHSTIDRMGKVNILFWHSILKKSYEDRVTADYNNAINHK